MRKKASLNLPSLLDIILIVLFGQIIYSIDMVPRAQTELKVTNEELASATVKLADTNKKMEKLKEKLKEITEKYAEHYKQHGENLTVEPVFLSDQQKSNETMPPKIKKSIDYTASAANELKKSLENPEEALRLALLVKSVKDSFAILNANMKDGEFELEGKQITYDIITKQNGDKDSLELKPKLRSFLKKEVSARAIIMLRFDPDMYLFLSKQACEVMDNLDLIYTTTYEFTELLNE